MIVLEFELFRDYSLKNYIYTIAGDALAPGISRSAATTVASSKG